MRRSFGSRSLLFNPARIIWYRERGCAEELQRTVALLSFHSARVTLDSLMIARMKSRALLLIQERESITEVGTEGASPAIPLSRPISVHQFLAKLEYSKSFTLESPIMEQILSFWFPVRNHALTTNSGVRMDPQWGVMDRSDWLTSQVSPVNSGPEWENWPFMCFSLSVEYDS